MAQRPQDPNKNMENPSEFDLNTALRCWLEALAQSPHFRKENVAELESHLRDSVAQLQGTGLSLEESFFIATRRVGSPQKLEGEFAKVNRNPMNKVIHGVIVACFAFACLCLWGMTKLALGGFEHIQVDLPLPTRLVIASRSLLWLLPAMAVAYCLSVWFGKNNLRHSWVGFFATVTGVLVLISFSTVIAISLPLLTLIGQVALK